MVFWMLSFICSFTHYLYVIVHDHHTNSKHHYQANSPSWKAFAVCSLSLLKSIGVVWKERNRRRRKRFFKSLLRFNHRFHPTNKLVLLPGRSFSSIGFLYLFFSFSVVCCFFDSIHDSFRFVFYSSLSTLSLYWLSTLLSVSLCFCCWNNRTDTPATWCSSMFPNMYFCVKLIYWDSYSYVQQHYWDVGPFHFYSFHHVFFYFFFGRNRSLSSFKPSPFYCWCSIPCLLPLLFILNSNVLPFPLFIDLILLLPFFLLFVILFVLLLPVLWLFISM